MDCAGSPVFVWVLSSFLLQSKHIQISIKLTGHSRMTVSVDVRLNGYFSSICWPCDILAAMSRLHSVSPNVGWDWIQPPPPHDSPWISGIGDGWMDLNVDY